MSNIINEAYFNRLVKVYKEELGDFYKGLDRAHGLDHFTEVFNTGRIINNSLDVSLRFDEELIFMVAFVHDIFTKIDRENHHLLSAGFVTSSTSSIFAFISSKERDMVSKACAEHRASFKGTYSSLFTELMASADRERPKSTESILLRAFMYHQDNNPGLTEVECLKRAKEHVKEKYGSKGYARYPKLYERAFEAELKEQREQIDNL